MTVWLHDFLWRHIELLSPNCVPESSSSPRKYFLSLSFILSLALYVSYTLLVWRIWVIFFFFREKEGNEKLHITKWRRKECCNRTLIWRPDRCMQIMCKYTRIAPILNPWAWPLGKNLQKLWCCWLFAAELSLGGAYCQDEWVLVGELYPPWASVWALLRVLDSPFPRCWLAWHFMILLIKLCVKEIERHIP